MKGYGIENPGENQLPVCEFAIGVELGRHGMGCYHGADGRQEADGTLRWQVGKVGHRAANGFQVLHKAHLHEQFNAEKGLKT